MLNFKKPSHNRQRCQLLQTTLRSPKNPNAAWIVVTLTTHKKELPRASPTVGTLPKLRTLPPLSKVHFPKYLLSRKISQTFWVWQKKASAVLCNR